MNNSRSEELSGIEGLLYIIPVLTIFFAFIFACNSNPKAMSWLTQCMHELISIIVAIAFIGWLGVSFIKDKLNELFLRAIPVVYC
ncbi:MAG: hypothetical protein ACFBSE_26935 [Prochloraceae cyanobacterium]